MPYTPNDSAPMNPKPGVVAWLRDRRVVAIAETNAVVSTGTSVQPGCFTVALYATFPDLRQIDWVLDIRLFTDPNRNLCLGSPYNHKMSGNIVGFTVVGTSGHALGTTVFAEVVALGPP